MWYENWLPVVEKHCQEKELQRHEEAKITYTPSEIVDIMKRRDIPVLMYGGLIKYGK